MIQPDGPIAQFLDYAPSVRNAKESFSEMTELTNFVKTFGLERRVSDGQNLVNEQNLGIDCDSDGNCSCITMPVE